MERIPLSARASWVERLKKEWRKNALVYIVMIPVLVHFLIFQSSLSSEASCSVS